MQNLIKSKLYLILILILVVCNSCISDKNDIYINIPKNTSLSIRLLRESNCIFKMKTGRVLIYNLENDDDVEEYNPHLLFFDNHYKLQSASYFFSEDIFFVKNNVITAYLNDYRSQRKGRFRNDIPKELKVDYKKYRYQDPSSIGIDKGKVINLKYHINEDTVDFTYLDSLKKQLKNVPLYKITYNYNNGEIIINNTYKSEMRESQVFKIDRKKLDLLFKDIL